MPDIVSKLHAHLRYSIRHEKRKGQPTKDLDGFCEWLAASSWRFIRGSITTPDNLHLIADALNKQSEATRQHWFVANNRLDFHHLTEEPWDWTANERPDLTTLERSQSDGATLVDREEYSALLRLCKSVSLYLAAIRGGVKQYTPQPKLGNKSALQHLMEVNIHYRTVTNTKEKNE